MFNHSTRTKPKAQAMVEFALVLMLLLTLLYGILEAGRLLFIYASTVTAARQAVRYGSTTGLNASNVPYYADCAGIKQAVKAIGFIAPYSDSDIHVTYDRGLDSSGNPIPINTSTWPLTKECETVNWANPNNALRNGDRINVSLSTVWQPVVNFIKLDSFTIASASSRTIISNVSIEVTAMPQDWGGAGSGGTLDLQVSAPTTYSAVGQVITFTYTLTNNGSGALSSPFSVAANLAPSACDGAPATLPTGDSITCYGTYIVTQADLDAGSVTNTATASASGATSGQVITTITAAQNPSLTLSKSASPAKTTDAGTLIIYTYTIDNTGNVTLSGPFSIDDDRLGIFECAGPLAPDDPPIACTRQYTITSDDILAGSVTNVATARFTYIAPDGTPIPLESTDSFTIHTAPIVLTVTPPPTITDVGLIRYSYNVRNNSDSEFTFALDNGGFTLGISCSTYTLAADTSTTCYGDHNVTQAELDAGGTLDNTVVATANGGIRTERTTSVAIDALKLLEAAFSPEPSPNPRLTEGDVQVYLTLRNTGKVTLKAPFGITDADAPDKLINLQCPDQSDLAPISVNPTALKTCTAIYTVTAADLAAGSVKLLAYGWGTYIPASGSPQTINSGTLFKTIYTHDGPRLSLTVTPDPTSVVGAGQRIVYTYTLTNTGRYPLTGFTISDDKASDESCAMAMDPLPEGESTTCSYGYYTTGPEDVSAGSVTNTVTVSAVSAGGPASDTKSTTVTVAPICQHGNLNLPAFSMNIYNNSLTSSLTISKIVIHWRDQPSNQKLNEIRLGGVRIWSGNSNGPADTTITTFSGSAADRTINSNTVKLLDINFGTTYTPFSPPAEWITVSFTDPQCSLDSRNAGQLRMP